MMHVILGPPCSGKSTYVRDHSEPGDVLVDYDAIAQALGSKEPYDAPKPIKSAAFAARSAVIAHVIDTGAEAWVIHASPTVAQMERYRAIGAEIVEMDTDMETCLERAEADGRPDWTAGVIRDWFGRNEKRGYMSHLTKEFNVELDGGDENERTFTGYASTFDREPDSYGDVIAKGAFEKTLARFKEKGRRIPLLFGHNMDDPDYNLGYVEAEEDERGLKVTGHIFMDTPKGQTVYQLLKRGQVDRMSFAFDVLDQGPVTLDGGVKVNELREVELFECSIVTVPANPHAEITDVKAADQEGAEEPEDMPEGASDRLGEIAREINDALGSFAEQINGFISAINGAADDSEQEQTDADGEGAEPEGTEAAKELLDAKKKAIIEILED